MAITLTYEKLLEEIDKVSIFESRIDQPDMKEFVIKSTSIMPLHLILQEFFGEDFKAPGVTPHLDEKKRVARWGGVRPNQTLYYAQSEGYSNCAMLWPWRDATRCTVKIVRWK